jgi:putative peptidoglycan lipid II flippase
MSQMLKSSGAMGVATMTSRILGLVREMIYARFMGDGWVAGAFTLAFMIPNLFRRLLGEGALTAAFIPIFKEKEKQAGEPEMWKAANAVICGLIVCAMAIVLVGMLGISFVLATGVKNPKTMLMLDLLRFMFPYMLLACLAAVFMGMLNSRGHFFIPAMGAALLNIILIASVLWLAPRLGPPQRLDKQIFGLAMGVLAAGVAQVAFQWPQLRREGFTIHWVSPWKNETVRHVVRQMIPGVIGVAAFQINVLLTSGFAFWVGDTIVKSFDYAVRLMELPQGVFGISLATYLLPTLSGLAAEKKYPEFRSTLTQGLGYLTFINLLASVLLLTLAEPIVRLLFERGRFDEAATVRASLALIFLAPGLVAFSSVNILARAFYALGDTRTPMKISVFCLVVNAIFAAALIWHFRSAVSLAIANTVSAFINVGLLFYALRHKLAKLDLTALFRQLPSMLGAAILAGAIAWGLEHLWEAQLGHATLWLKIGATFVPMCSSALVYFVLTWWLKVSYVQDFLTLAAAGLNRSRGQA